MIIQSPKISILSSHVDNRIIGKARALYNHIARTMITNSSFVKRSVMGYNINIKCYKNNGFISGYIDIAFVNNLKRVIDASITIDHELGIFGNPFDHLPIPYIDINGDIIHNVIGGYITHFTPDCSTELGATYYEGDLNTLNSLINGTCDYISESLSIEEFYDVSTIPPPPPDEIIQSNIIDSIVYSLTKKVTLYDNYYHLKSPASNPMVGGAPPFNREYTFRNLISYDYVLNDGTVIDSSQEWRLESNIPDFPDYGFTDEIITDISIIRFIDIDFINNRYIYLKTTENTRYITDNSVDEYNIYTELIKYDNGTKTVLSTINN